jgi:hypothetical protein
MGRTADAPGYTSRVPNSEPFLVPGDDATLETILAAAWSLLERAAARAPEDWRWPVLASVDPTEPERGVADARVVVLRRADARAWTLEVHSDARAGKLAQLRAAPHACLVFHDRSRELQLRAWVDASVHEGDAIARRAWDALHASSRRAYLAPRTPGEPTAAPDANQPAGLGARLPDAAESEPGFASFAAIVLRVRTLEWLRLDRAGHHRARFEADSAGGAPAMCWLRP